MKEIMQSGVQQTKDNEALEFEAHRVTRLETHIADAIDLPGEPIDSELEALSREARSIAREIINIVRSLRYPDEKRRVWRVGNAFKAVARGMYEKGRMQKLAEKLDTLQHRTHLRLTLILNARQGSVLASLEAIETSNRRMEQTQKVFFGDMRSEVLSQAQKIESRPGRFKRLLEAPLVPTRDFDSETTISNSTLALPQDTASLSAELSKLIDRGRELAKEQELLNSLAYEDMDECFQKINRALDGSYRWLFDGTALHPSHESSFVDWLETGSGVHWISGKPGSGKSTFMKWIVESSLTVQSLQKWSGGRQLHIAKFFFKPMATKLENPIENLLRTLLYQILQGYPTLTTSIIADFQKGRDIQWYKDDLLTALKRLRDELTAEVSLCIFIDGLDEYRGDKMDVVSVISDLLGSNHIKICASSRIHNEIEDAFLVTKSQRLQLEHHTRTDILNYIQQRFSTSLYFIEKYADQEQYINLAGRIVEEARGVFLWVVLVVRSLLEGFRNFDDDEHIENRLQQLPDRLEKYFYHIYEQLDTTYSKRTARFFLALLEHESLPLLTLQFAADDTALAEKSLSKSMSESEIMQRTEATRRQLTASCRGLLEATTHWRSSSQPFDATFEYMAVWMHPTTRFYFQSRTRFNALIEDAGESFDPQLAKCNGIVRTLHCCPAKTRTRLLQRHVFESLVMDASIVQQERRSEAIDLLLKAEHILLSYPSKDNTGEVLEQNWMVASVITEDVGTAFKVQYLETRLSLEPSLLTKVPGRPLLDHALAGYVDEGNLHIVKTLLKYRADPNQEYDGKSLWERCLLGYIAFIVQQGSFDEDGNMWPWALSLFMLLISYGANTTATLALHEDPSKAPYRVQPPVDMDMTTTPFYDKETEEIALPVRGSAFELFNLISCEEDLMKLRQSIPGQETARQGDSSWRHLTVKRITETGWHLASSIFPRGFQ